MGQNRKKHRINSHVIVHYPTSEVSEEVKDWAQRSAQAKQVVNKWAVRANKRMDERVAQYFSLYSWLFWTIVHWEHISVWQSSSYIIARWVTPDKRCDCWLEWGRYFFFQKTEIRKMYHQVASIKKLTWWPAVFWRVQQNPHFLLHCPWEYKSDPIN